MPDFIYDTRDLKFILNEWLDMEKVLSFDKFKENYETDDMELILNEVYKIAKNMVYPANRRGHETGVKFENGIVKVPQEVKDAYIFLQENGWGTESESIGSDTAMPLTLFRGCAEILSAACPALMSYIKLTSGAANLIYRYGTDKDRELFYDNMLSGKWTGTMCLTEPNAGSDVGDAATRAYPTGDPRIYKIKGTKMFITGGEVDLGENIIHMVLARPEGGAPGSKGLGLYIVPKIWVNDDGSPGDFNDVICTGVEHKMGLKSSSTAMLNFGENDNCYGILVGEPPDEEGKSKGLAMMFNMMNESRIGTGHNALAQLAAASYFASQYAAERIQGRPFTDRKSERVPIIKHEDIKRTLMELKAQVEGIRAMIYKGFYCSDIAEFGSDREEAEKCRGITGILTPLIKTYASETAWPLVGQAIQVFGGVGYTEEYPVAQYARDVKILSIWEGTSFIQAMDLVGRKMRMQDGKVFNAWLEERKQFIEANKNAAGFSEEMAKLENAYIYVNSVKDCYDTYFANLQQDGQLVPLYATRVLTCVAQLYIAECLLDQAILAKEKNTGLSEDHPDYYFYAGKEASARYFVHNILPNVYMLAEMIKNPDRTALDYPEQVLGVN